MITSHTRWLRLTAAAIVLLAVSIAAHGEPLLKEGDRMVFLGDSITQQRIYTRYVMDYFALRHPELHVTFRNAGVSGDTATGAIARLDKDVLALKPNVVSICFGMNDAGYGPFEQERYEAFIAAMTVLLSELKEADATVVLLTPGPVDPDRGESWLDGRVYNDVLQRYAEGVKELGARRGVAVCDSRALLFDVQTRARAADPKFTMIPDAIHPGPPGQALMAYALLQGLGCKGAAAGLTVEAAAGTFVADRCAVSGLVVTPEEVRFSRRDDALPTFFDPEVAAISPHAAAIAGLNAYPFQVTGLQAGLWRLEVGGVGVGEFTSEELAKGIDLSARPGPWQELACSVDGLVRDQEDIYLQKRSLGGLFRWVSTPPPEAEVEKLALMRKLDDVVVARERAWAELVEDRTWEWRLTRVP